MVARRKKKVQNKRVVVGPAVIKVQDPRQPPLEVLEESLTRQSPGGPRMESSTMEVILQLLREVSKDIKHLRDGQDSLLSDMVELRTSVGQMNQWLDLAESRFSSLEDKACETYQTNSVNTASQAHPMGEPTASSPSFSAHQTILDPAQVAVSPSSASVYPSSEPAPPSASEQFRTASGTLMDSESEEKAHQMLADPWSQEKTSESESAHTEDEESGQQEDTFSEDSLLIVPEYKTKPQRLMNNLLETPQPPSPAEMQKETPLTDTKLAKRHPTNRRSSSASASTAASSRALRHLVSSPPSEVMSPTKRPQGSIAWHYFTKHPTSKFIATCNICRMDVKTGKIGGCGKVGTSSLLQHIKHRHHITQDKKVPSKICNIGRSSTVERSRRIRSAASACTTISAAVCHSLSSSPPSEMRSPAKHPRMSIAWRYFTKNPTSKFIATCNICGLDVTTGKIGGKVGTAALLSHIKRIHHIFRKK